MIVLFREFCESVMVSKVHVSRRCGSPTRLRSRRSITFIFDRSQTVQCAMWSSIRSTSSTYATISTCRRYTASSVGRPRRPALRTSPFVPPGSWHSQCPGRLQRVAAFHSTPRRNGLPAFGPVVLAIFKSSAALEIARTAGRIALTFVPVILIKNRKSLYWLKKAEIHGIPTTEEKKAQLLKYIRKRTVLLHLLFFVPVFTFWLTIVASLERTPLTGRWRLIILSPEEEDEIASQLAGSGWYKAVHEILLEGGPFSLIPTTDWRYEWIRDTLRNLEAYIPVLEREGEIDYAWTQRGPDDDPLPPPAEYPLKPRPRGSELLWRFCERLCEREVPLPPHTSTGPPYSLLFVDKPEASNAFSYGFGPNGGGGIVVYSGFLDEILSSPPADGAVVTAPPEEKSWWSSIVDSLLGRRPPPSHPIPTREQTADLAVLLAHELAHLVLSHHLETLSSGTIIIPTLISIITDVVRTVLFPITMLFGPFVNDAVAQLGKVGSGELVKMGDYCTSMSQEVEADVVSARLLAHAGFDARHAVRFWEKRSEFGKSECGHADKDKDELSSTSTRMLPRQIMGSSHPMNQVRVERLRSELDRWEAERRAALQKSGTNET
ncbi:hypothetical protein PC9H_009783 [Pleurotus ostreatus]|uniref:Peptidase M48 domain-containing protein n=1 Tax=Pleurotus ostreatus TaxID=5322 RepID=A0A8H6ZRY8_PLEOS|nr:uncharacterized protein PC9H_009783 [Pleurotus ostreatus]KAF7424476.1 hypothetical protein PC9H_009783 [Pleurotus ostreatus]